MNLMESISEIIQLSKSRIAKDSAIVLTGNMLSAGLGFIATILITRTLGPAQFGLFSVALAVMGIASQFSDFGVGTGMVRFASLYLKNDIQKANLIFKVSLKLKLIIATVVFLIGFFASESLAVHVFGKLELIFPLQLAFIGAFGTSLMGYVSTTLQARQSFKKFTFVNLIDPLIKVSVIGLLFLTYKLNLLSALTTVIILPFIAFLISSLIIPKDFLRAKGDENEALHELFHFSKWILVSVFCVMIIMRLDVLMLSYFKVIEEVGYYSAAYSLTLALSLITRTFTTTLLPETSKLITKEKIRHHLKRYVSITGIIAMFIFPLYFLASPIILTLYGIDYTMSIVLFKILLINQLIILTFNPIGVFLYSINRPQIATFTNIAQLSFNFAGNYILIPTYGAFGAAIVTLFTNVVGISFIGLYLIWYLKKKE